MALAGDGAFLMTGLEILTAAREGVGVMVLVLRDRELAQIAQFQDTALSRKVASEVADYDLGDLAKGMGIDFLVMATDEDVPTVVDRAAGVATVRTARSGGGGHRLFPRRPSSHRGW